MQRLILALAAAFLACSEAKVVLARRVSALNQADLNPIELVVDKLRNMQKELKKQGEEDQVTYNKFKCFAESTIADNKDTIAECNQKIGNAEGDIQENAGSIGTLGEELKNLNADLDEANKAISDNTDQQNKMNAEFNENEKDLLVSIQAVGNAVKVLKKHQSFLELPKQSVMDIASMLNNLMMKKGQWMNPSDQETVSSFVQSVSSKDYWDAKNTFSDSHASQSGAIFGILGNMLDQFKADLKNSRNENVQQNSDFTQLIKDKQAEAAELQANIDSKEAARSAAQDAHTKAKQTLAEKTEQRDISQKSKDDLTQELQDFEQQNAARNADRAAEQQAINEAIEILDGDEAHATFQGAHGKFFLQLSSTQMQKLQSFLMLKSQQLKAPKLAALAVEAAAGKVGDAFGMVIKAINGMVKDLEKDRQDEVVKNDYCRTALNENNMNTKENTENISLANAALDEANSSQEAAESEIQKQEAEIVKIANTKADITKERERTNKEFQEKLEVNQASIPIMQKAVKKLQAYYEQKGFLQAQRPRNVARTAKFAKRKQSGGTGVIKMIQKIVAETQQLQRDLINEEKSMQADYEQEMQDLAEKNDAANASKDNETKKRADAADNAEDSADNLQKLGNEKSELEGEKFDLLQNTGCESLMENFADRQKAFTDEAEALREALDIIKGANTSSDGLSK